MRQTLLEMVQDILADMKSDQVDSINDTVESYDVALIIRRTFYDIAAELDLPAHDTIFQLVASGDNNLPCVMTAPTNMMELHDIQYDNKESGDTYSNWQHVEYCPFQDFLYMTNQFSGMNDVTEMNVSNGTHTFEIMCRTDKFPQYYTTFDDTTYIFDSYKDTEDTTLQAAKTLCQGKLYPSFTMADSFTPTLNPQQFPYLYNKAKTRAFYQIKQMPNQESAAETRDQKIRLMRTKRRTENLTALELTPRYGKP